MSRLLAWLSTLWCERTHGGGRIERDHLGRWMRAQLRRVAWNVMRRPVRETNQREGGVGRHE